MLTNWTVVGVKPATTDSLPVNRVQQHIPVKTKSKKKSNSRINKMQTESCQCAPTETEADSSTNRKHFNELPPRIPETLPASFQHFLEHSYRMIADVEESKGGLYKKTNEQQDNLNWNSNAPIQLRYNSSNSNEPRESLSVKHRKERNLEVWLIN